MRTLIINFANPVQVGFCFGHPASYGPPCIAKAAQLDAAREECQTSPDGMAQVGPYRLDESDVTTLIDAAGARA